MLKSNKVAITGGLSCGKSSVCRFLKEFGAYVISSDDIVHHLLSSNTSLVQEVIKLLGTDILINQEISRTVVAQKVFQNVSLLQALEQILHPAVYDEINNEYQKQMKNKHHSPLFIAEVPLLFESHGESHFDCTVAVLADVKLCRDRFIHAKFRGAAEYSRRMNRQLPNSEKAKRADFVLVNNGTLSDLKQKAFELYQNLIKFHKTAI